MGRFISRNFTKKLTAVFLALTLLASGFSPIAFAAPGDIERVPRPEGEYGHCSTGYNGQGRGISDDANVVIFTCTVDMAPYTRAFVWDRASNTVTPISEEANGHIIPRITPDGRYILFSTNSTNLDPRDTDSWLDLYLFDRVTNITELVSTNGSGEKANLSSDGQLSADGQFLVLSSRASNLVADDTNNSSDVFLKNLNSGEVKRISVGDDGSQLTGESYVSGISRDGRYVFYRHDDDGSNILVYDTKTDITENITSGQDLGRLSGGVSISEDGRYLAFLSDSSNLVPNDTNNSTDAFVYDRETSSMQMVNTSASGQQGGTCNCIYHVQISGNGRYAIFHTMESDLVPDAGIDIDDRILIVYRKDIVTGEIEIISFTAPDYISTLYGGSPAISSDGRYVAFNSIYDNLVPEDTNGLVDTFIKELTTDNDYVAPSITNTALSTNPKAVQETSVLSASVSDDDSGVAAVEYFIGEDPGVGNGADMFFDGTTASVTIGTDMPVGVYQYSVRAQDNAGNWSDPVSVFLTVYDPSGGFVTAARHFVPSLANGDVLPGLTDPNQTTKAQFGATVKYQNGGLQGNNNDFAMSYAVGNGCQSPNSNCTGINVDATSIDWLILGDNDTKGTFQGTADVTVDGTTTSNPYQVEVYNSGHDSTPNYIVVKIFAPGADPNTATPLYQASGNITGNVNVQQI